MANFNSFPAGNFFEERAMENLVDFFESDHVSRFGYFFYSHISSWCYFLIDTVLNARNNSLFTSIAFLDLLKAFYCVSHAILIKKLFHYGVRGSYLNCFSCNLDQRKSMHTVESLLDPLSWTFFVFDMWMMSIFLIWQQKWLCLQTTPYEFRRVNIKGR